MDDLRSSQLQTPRSPSFLTPNQQDTSLRLEFFDQPQAQAQAQQQHQRASYNNSATPSAAREQSFTFTPMYLGHLGDGAITSIQQMEEEMMRQLSGEDDWGAMVEQVLGGKAGGDGGGGGAIGHGDEGDKLILDRH